MKGLRTIAMAAVCLGMLGLLTACNTNEYGDDQYTYTQSNSGGEGSWTIAYSGDISMDRHDGKTEIYMPHGGNIKISGTGNFVVHGCSSLKATNGAHVEAHDCSTVKALPSTTIVAYNCQTIYASASVNVEPHGPANVILLDASEQTGALPGDLPTVGTK